MKKHIVTILCFLASFCFLLCYFIREHNTLYLLLGLTWLFIGLEHLSRNKKRKDEKNSNFLNKQMSL